MPIAESILEDVLARLGHGRAATAFESEELDFKADHGSLKAVLELLANAAVCFANTRGGTIVLGVDDKATARVDALRGVRPALTVDAVRKGIFDRSRPAITTLAREHIEDGARLIVVDVPPGVGIHSNASGRATRRLGTECLPYTPDEQRARLEARGLLDWSAAPSGIPIAKLSVLELERLRQLLRSARNDELAALADTRVLEALHLIAEDGSATFAAVILLADEPTLRTVVPAYSYAYQYRPTPGSEATARFRRSRPLLAAVDDLILAVESRASVHPLNVAGGVQLALVDYPTRAVRELVVNALIHQDFTAPGDVEIEHSAATLTITNPGGLVGGVTPANILTHPSNPRHRLLAETVVRVQLAERTGQGIDRAYREMLTIGKSPPAFIDDGFTVTATLRGGTGNDAFARFANELPNTLAGDVEALLALHYLRDTQTITAETLAPIIQRTPADAQSTLARLAGQPYELIEPSQRTSSRAHPTYRLRPKPLAALARAVTYHRRAFDHIDEKVIDHVREYGYITNRTIQRQFDMTVFAARDIITGLRKRGLLSKEGDARGGPGVRYVAGPKFPGEPPATIRQSASEPPVETLFDVKHEATDEPD